MDTVRFRLANFVVVCCCWPPLLLLCPAVPGGAYRLPLGENVVLLLSSSKSVSIS
jgi:hypothetical protein